MMLHCKSWRAVRCRLPVGLLWLACSSPDLDHTLFSCETTADCAPGQLCVLHQGELTCQQPLASDSACPDGSCRSPAPDAGSAGLQPALADPSAWWGGICREGDCSPTGPSRSITLREPEALGLEPWGDAGVGSVAAAFDASPGWSSVCDQRPEDTLDGT